MATCDPNDLMSRAGCFACLDRGALAVIKTQLLCNVAQNINPTPPPPDHSFLQQENLSYILQENGSKIIIT